MADVKNALRAEHYDVVLDIQGLMRSAMVARWAGVPATGYSWGTAREPIASLAYARKLDLPASLGAVRRYRMAAAEALGYEIDPERPVFGLQANAEPSVKPAGPYAALAVNTSRDEKLWPEEYWTHLGRKFAGAGLRSVLFWGSDVERERVERLVRTFRRRSGSEDHSGDDGRHAGPCRVRRGVSTRGLPISGRRSVVRASGIFVSTPTETLKLVGDGPVRSLGGIGQCPDVDEVWKALVAVQGERL